MEKIKYEKPISLNAGEVASVLGEYCIGGQNASDGCGFGHDPSTIGYCPNGDTATTNCWTHGTAALQGCWVGDAAGLGCNQGNSYEE